MVALVNHHGHLTCTHPKKQHGKIYCGCGWSGYTGDPNISCSQNPYSHTRFLEVSFLFGHFFLVRPDTVSASEIWRLHFGVATRNPINSQA